MQRQMVICFVLLAMQTENALCNHRCSRCTEVRQKGNILLFFLPDDCFVAWEYCANRTCIPQWSLQPPLHSRRSNDTKKQFRQKCSISETQMNKYSHPDRFVQTDISILVPFPLCFHFKSDNETFIWYGVFHIVCLPDSVNVHNLTFRRQRELFWKQG